MSPQLLVEDLLREREAQYGGAWAETGRVAVRYSPQLTRLLTSFPEAWYPWIMILCKLIRILTSPRHLDSWRDIEGYARLVVAYLEKEADNDDIPSE